MAIDLILNHRCLERCFRCFQNLEPDQNQMQKSRTLPQVLSGCSSFIGESLRVIASGSMLEVWKQKVSTFFEILNARLFRFILTGSKFELIPKFSHRIEQILAPVVLVADH